MPKGTKVSDCVERLMAQGHAEANAIRICQDSTGQSYMTGKKSKNPKNKKGIGR